VVGFFFDEVFRIFDKCCCRASSRPPSPIPRIFLLTAARTPLYKGFSSLTFNSLMDMMDPPAPWFMSHSYLLKRFSFAPPSHGIFSGLSCYSRCPFVAKRSVESPISCSLLRSDVCFWFISVVSWWQGRACLIPACFFSHFSSPAPPLIFPSPPSGLRYAMSPPPAFSPCVHLASPFSHSISPPL